MLVKVERIFVEPGRLLFRNLRYITLSKIVMIKPLNTEVAMVVRKSKSSPFAKEFKARVAPKLIQPAI
jgi:hypothetical protein